MNLSTGYDFISNTLENTSNLSMANYHNFIVAEWDQATLNDTLASMDAAITDYVLSLDLNEHHLYGAARIGVQKKTVSRWKREIANGSFTDGLTTYTGTITDPSVETYDVENYKNRKGSKLYQLSNHLGNVLAVISDRLLSKDDNNDNVHDYYATDISNATDYYPYGMEMPGRTYTNTAFVDGEYGYGFQNQEGDDEHNGSGNSYAFKYRIHDPRIGKFLSIDPLAPKYPHNSPYAFSENRVLDMIELDGLEATNYWMGYDPLGTMMVGFSQIFDAAFNMFSFELNVSPSLSKTNEYEIMGNVETTNKTVYTGTVEVKYSGWDLFDPNAHSVGGGTTKNIPKPKGGVSAFTKVENVTQVKATVGPNTNVVNKTTVDLTTGATSNSSTVSTTIKLNGWPIRTTAESNTKSNGTTTSTLTIGVGTGSNQVYVGGVSKTENGSTANQGVVGAKAKVETPSVGGWSIGLSGGFIILSDPIL